MIKGEKSCFYDFFILKFDDNCAIVMSLKIFYTIDTSKVVFEKFEDETVLINLTSGNYYGTMNVGKAILTFLENGISFQNLLNIISTSYGKEIAEIEVDIQDFLTTLVNEGLVQITDLGSNEFSALENCNEYEKPLIEKYSDMQDLILLDPVHDVNSKGWPNANSEEVDKPNL